MSDNNSNHGFRGVKWEWQTQRFRTRIAGKWVGRFMTAEEAARAYDTAARKLYGSEAVLNFPGEGVCK